MSGSLPRRSALVEKETTITRFYSKLALASSYSGQTPRRSDGPVLSRTVVSEEDALDARADGLIVQDREQDRGSDVAQAQKRCEKRAEDDDALELIGVGEEVGVRADVEPVLVPVGFVVAAPRLGLIVVLRPCLLYTSPSPRD